MHDLAGGELIGYQRADLVAQNYLGTFLLTCVPGAVSEEPIDALGVGSKVPTLHVDAAGRVTVAYIARMFPSPTAHGWEDDAWLMFAQR